MAVPPSAFRVSPSSGVPIFRQLIDQVNAMVGAGKLQPGDMLPSTREVAKTLEVNMMTVSKAYSRLEIDGVAERIRGRGMRICEVSSRGSLSERKAEFRSQVEPAIHRARQLGLTNEQILALINKTMKETGK